MKMNNFNLKKCLLSIACLLIFAVTNADNPPFELNVSKEGGKLIEVHGGFLGLQTINIYYGFDRVDQYWAVDKNGTRVCHVECKGEGNSHCQAYIDGDKISLIIPEDIIVDIDILNKEIQELIDISDVVISDSSLKHSEVRKMCLKTTEGKNKILVLKANYIFQSCDKGIINITMNILDKYI